ncbi:MAG: SAM-dependent methyltransferase [Alphaproteobacteria bacterium]|nr:SAM-dependent methyltransferase [Alphaproteobacteria bacterium]
MTEQRPETFDRALYLQRLGRRRVGMDHALAEAIASALEERLSEISRQFDEALILSPYADLLAKRIAATGRMGGITPMVPPMADTLALAAGSHDAILDILDLHCVNDVPGRLAQVRRALRPDGLYLACFFGGETLTELRQAWIEAELEVAGQVSPRVAPMIDVRVAGALMHEVSRLGLSNALAARSRLPVTRRLLAAAVSHYQSRNAGEDGRVAATLELLWLTAWSPHESQPRPLKPGSAARRLADALGTSETRLKADRSDAE